MGLLSISFFWLGLASNNAEWRFVGCVPTVSECYNSCGRHKYAIGESGQCSGEFPDRYACFCGDIEPDSETSEG